MVKQTPSKTKNLARIAPLVMASLLAGACATVEQKPSASWQARQTATGVTIRDSDLGLPTEASVEYIRVKPEKSIFLSPPVDNLNVYVDVNDATDRDWGGIDIRQLVIQKIESRGYNAVPSLKNAAYSLQAIIRLAEEVSAAELAKLDETKYGEDPNGVIKRAAVGTAVGAGVGALGGGGKETLIGAAAGGLIGGLSSALAGSRKEDLVKAQQQTRFFSVVADLRIAEKIDGTVRRQGSQTIDTLQRDVSDVEVERTNDTTSSISSTETETFTQESNWRNHQTRIIGKAKGKLVTFEDVKTEFANKLISSIAGFF